MTQQPQRQAPTSTAKVEASDFERLLKQPEKPMEYVPFGGTDPIRITVGIVQKLIATRTKSGETCSPEDAMRFMMMCMSRRLNPFEGDAFLIGYDTRDGAKFTITTSHQAFLKRGEVHPEFQGMESGIVVLLDGVPVDREGDFHLPEEVVVGGWARVHRKDRTIPVYKRLRLATFAQAYGRWQIDAAGMICKCAEADGMRSAFPTLVGGMYLDGEIKIDLTPAQLAGANYAPHRSDKVEVVPAKPTPAGDEAAEAEAGLAPAPEPEMKAVETPPQVRLSDLVTGAGYTFGHLQTWGAESGNIDQADSMVGFREIPTATAERLLRAKVGLLKGLEAIKATDRKAVDS